MLKIEKSSPTAFVLALELEKSKKKKREMRKASDVDPQRLKEVATQMFVLFDALALLGVGNTMVTIKSKVALL